MRVVAKSCASNSRFVVLRLIQYHTGEPLNWYIGSHSGGGVVCHSGWSLVGWVCCTGWTDSPTYINPGIHGPQNGSSESGADGVDPPLAAAALDRGSPNLMGYLGFVGRTGEAEVRVDIAVCK